MLCTLLTFQFQDLMRILLDKEDAIKSVVEDYERGGSRLVKHVKEQQEAFERTRKQEFATNCIVVEKSCKKLRDNAWRISRDIDAALLDRKAEEVEWSKKQESLMAAMRAAKVELMN